MTDETIDIVDRIRNNIVGLRDHVYDARCDLCNDNRHAVALEAAAEIERLRSETKRTLRAQIREKARERDEWKALFASAAAEVLALERELAALRLLLESRGIYDYAIGSE